MGSLLRPVTYPASATLKTVVIDDSTGTPRWWNTSGTPAFEAYNAANVADYGIDTPNNAGAAYNWIVPALPPSSLAIPYQSLTFRITGSDLAAGDLVNAVYEDSFGWTGTAFRTVFVHNATVNVDGVNVVQVNGVDAKLGSLGGGGAFAMIINVKDQNNNPVPAATVRATGSALAWGATDNNGNATLSLDPGSYTITATATGFIGYTSTVQTVQSPGTWVSSSSAILPISITNVMPPAPPAGMITGYLYTQVPGTTIYYAMVIVPPGSGMQLSGLTQAHTSDSSGLWDVPLYLGATYTFNSGNGPTNTILIPESGSLLELQNLLSL